MQITTGRCSLIWEVKEHLLRERYWRKKGGKVGFGENIPRQRENMCKGPKARRILTGSKNSKRLMWLHRGGEWQEIRLIVLFQESKRNVCEHALRSTKAYTTVRTNTVISVSRVLPQHQQQRAKKKKKNKTHLNPSSTSSVFPKLTISLTSAVNQSVRRFSIFTAIVNLNVRPNYLFCMYPTGLL